MLDQVGGVEGSAPSYPPYNIARTAENDYRISVAVAGFTDADLAIEAKENTLTLRGEKQARRRAATYSTRASPRGTSNVASNSRTMCRSRVRA
jgi:molecular chaperone IbpA